MARNIGLANIYVKIRNKRTLTIDDLVFLSIFDPECFKKTCSNLLYNLPEAKVLMEKKLDTAAETAKTAEIAETKVAEAIEEVKNQSKQSETEIHTRFVSKSRLEQEKVDVLLDNLKKMEWESNIIKDIDSEQVKNLLGNLYMEMLFPHSEKFRYFCLEDHIESSGFDKKA